MWERSCHDTYTYINGRKLYANMTRRTYYSVSTSGHGTPARQQAYCCTYCCSFPTNRQLYILTAVSRVCYMLHAPAEISLQHTVMLQFHEGSPDPFNPLGAKEKRLEIQRNFLSSSHDVQKFLVLVQGGVFVEWSYARYQIYSAHR